jgi:hypothetical protein
MPGYYAMGYLSGGPFYAYRRTSACKDAEQQIKPRTRSFCAPRAIVNSLFHLPKSRQPSARTSLPFSRGSCRKHVVYRARTT